MTQTIDIEVKRPVNNTGLEVVSFETGIENGENYLRYVVKNTTTKTIRVRNVEVYYLDASGKIVKKHNLGVAPSMISIYLAAGEEVRQGVSGGSAMPTGVVEILIYEINT